MTASSSCAHVNLSKAILDTYLGLSITDICPHGYTDPDLNHCAHFVCHVMSVATGSTSCKAMVRARVAGKMGVCIRVHELFKACPEVGHYQDASTAMTAAGLFVFVTATSAVNLASQSMTNIPRKHVGIGLDGTIWHYSNTRDRVVTATTDEFQQHDRGQSNGLYFGRFPATAAPATFGCGR